MTDKATFEFATSQHRLYKWYSRDWIRNAAVYAGGQDFVQANLLHTYSADYRTDGTGYSKALDPDLLRRIETLRKDGVPLHQGLEEQEYADYLIHSHGVLPPVGASGNAALDADAAGKSDIHRKKQGSIAAPGIVKQGVDQRNSILFSQLPTRQVGEAPLRDSWEHAGFLDDVDGDGTTMNDLMGQVDRQSTVQGAVHVSVVSYDEGEVQEFPVAALHQATDILNWSHVRGSRSLVLDQVAIRMETAAEYTWVRYMDRARLIDVYTRTDGKSDRPAGIPGYAEEFVEDKVRVWHVTRANSLGVVPLVTMYHSDPLDGQKMIGTTPITDVAKTSVLNYNLLAQTYEAIVRGIHPLLFIDAETAKRNPVVTGGPGGLLIGGRKANDTDSAPPVAQYLAHALDDLEELRNERVQLEITMREALSLRDRDMIQSSRSGTQVEMYDLQLRSEVVAKAKNMATAELQILRLVQAWMTPADEAPALPEGIVIQYNASFSRKTTRERADDLNQTLALLDRVAVDGDKELQEARDRIRGEVVALANSVAEANTQLQ